MARKGDARDPAINVNDSVTKSKFDNLYGVPREPGRRDQARDRRHARRQDRGRRRLWRRGQGLGRVAAQLQGARVMVTEIDPICALQAAMEGYQVVTMDEAASIGDIFVTATGNMRRHHARPHAADEGPGDRLQHRPLRQRDPDRVPVATTPGTR
jgi:adenosylhomocysteinase